MFIFELIMYGNFLKMKYIILNTQTQHIADPMLVGSLYSMWTIQAGSWQPGSMSEYAQLTKVGSKQLEGQRT